MSIILQHFEVDIPELVGAVCERFLCLQFRDDTGNMIPGVLWLKIAGGAWHRFFIDAWVLFWRELDDFEDESDSDCVFYDLGSHFAFEGGRIAGINMRQTPDDAEFDARLTISFADGRVLILQHKEDPAQVRLTVSNAA